MRWSALVSAALVLRASTAFAQTEGTPTANYPLEIVHQYLTIDVNNDGTFTSTTDQLYLLKTQQGVQALRTALVGYSESLQEGDLLEVYTLKPDGKRIDAPVDQALPRSAPMVVSAPMFDDIKIRVLAFQNAEPGDQVGAVARVKQKTPYIPGQFSLAHIFSRSMPAREVKVTITAPKEYPLHFDVAGIENKPPAVVDGKNQWTWTFKNDEAQAPDQGIVGEFDFAPHVVVSSFADWAVLAKGYEARARDKAAVTPAIQELADRLTKDTKDKREQVHLLYDWVATNIKYVAINFGVGAIVPHPAGDVLTNLYGDCKDHVTLLQALLKAKGIDSTAALIDSGTSYKMSTVAAMGAFNHVITYIPSMKLYLDSTSHYAPFGTLPAQDADKTVLLTATGKLDHTPFDPAASSFRTVTTLKVHDDGSADGDTRMTASGRMALAHRTTIAGLPPQQEQNFLRTIVGDNTGATLDRGDPEKSADTYEFGVHFKVTNYLQIPGPGAISFSAGPRVPGRVAGLASLWTLPHQHDFLCGSGRFTEEIAVELPASVKVTSLPKPQETAVEGVKLSTTYARDSDQTIKATRTLEITEPHPYCSAEHNATLRADFVKLNGLLGAQALYE